jgi:hypothetical protein
MVDKALQNRPNADHNKLEQSIAKASFTVGITRQGIVDVLEAEMETLVAMRVLGTSIPNDFLAGMLASIDLVRDGRHVLDDYDSHNNWS